MRHELSAAHELVLGRLAERVAHAAMIAAEADPARDRAAEIFELFLGDRRHGVAAAASR
jgi:hypothetical protein